jgi:hypothetical protein
MMLPATIYPRVMHVLTLISQGLTLTTACEQAQIPTSTLLKHVQTAPELQDAYVEAEQRGLDTLADILLNIFSDPHYGQSDPRRAQILSNNIQWYLARKRPSQYGDRQIIETHITADKAIVEALSRGRERAERAALDDVPYTVVSETPIKRAEIDLALVPPELREFV